MWNMCNKTNVHTNKLNIPYRVVEFNLLIIIAFIHGDK